MLFLAAACSKQPAAEDEKAIERIPESISIKANSERMWSNTDVLSVFDSDLNKVNLRTTSDNVPSAQFTTSSWTGKHPLQAAFCCDKDVNEYVPEGIFRLVIKDRQTFRTRESSSKEGEAAVGYITGSPGSYEVDMKNVCAFIRAKLNNPIIASIKATAVGGETMNGFIDVDYDKLVEGSDDFWKLTEGKDGSSTVTATFKGGCFETGWYLISVLPGTYSKGIRLSFLNDEDTEILEMTIGEEGLTLGRNQEVMAEVDIDTSAGHDGVTHEGVTPGQGTGYDE